MSIIWVASFRRTMPLVPDSSTGYRSSHVPPGSPPGSLSAGRLTSRDTVGYPGVSQLVFTAAYRVESEATATLRWSSAMPVPTSSFVDSEAEPLGVLVRPEHADSVIG